MEWHVKDVLKEAVERGASDLHLSVGKPPTLRIDGTLYPAEREMLKPEHTIEIAKQILNDSQLKTFREKGELDLSYSYSGVGRFRVNAFIQRGSVGMAIRILNTKIPGIRELGLPLAVEDFARFQRGLFLVTGPTGSGKSTTLASIVGKINGERNCHILTLEDPIEYVHRHEKSLINQREMGQDTTSFPNALRSALRQDPDVILVGEMRDLETISTAITAAETGHLILATLHTSDAPQTIDRIIDVFPPHQQQQIRVQLASNLLGVMCQQLLPRSDGKGRVVATEVMSANAAAKNLIREGKVYQLYTVLQTGAKHGMQLMDDSIMELYDKRFIDQETAVEYAMDPDRMTRVLKQRV